MRVMAETAYATSRSDRRTAIGSREKRHHMTAAPVSELDGSRFRSVLGHFATGVVAITAIDPATGKPTGMAANSFTSVSLEPALVAFCVAHTSTTWPLLRTAGRLCVNILGEPQLEISDRLARRGGDKFAGTRWTRTPGGAPLID